MELPHIGQNCIVCNRNDYLPFKCKCDKIICIDHRSNHGCPLNRTNTSSDETKGYFAESLKKSCDFCRLITLKVELVECQECRGNHCLYHRHQEQHNCPKLTERKEVNKIEAEERSIRQKNALDKLKDSIKANQIKQSFYIKPVITDNPKKIELAKQIRLMRIKQSARGPPNILQDDKIYFEIKFMHESQSPISDAKKHDKIIKIFTSNKHTIGRMIDWSSDELGVANKNHIMGASQLVFKKQDKSGELLRLDSQFTFLHYLSNGILENGDEIVLTYETIAT